MMNNSEVVVMDTPPQATRTAVSRAAMQRLAADVGAKCSAAQCVVESEEMERFVGQVVKQAIRAGKCTKRKSVGRAQMQYGLKAAGAPVPPEICRLSDAELRRLRRCNVRAPAQTRKPSALSVEIPEASFARLLVKVTSAESDDKVRFSAAARRVLHATAEMRAAQRLKNQSQNQQEPTTTQPVLLPGVQRVLESCGATTAAAMNTASIFENVCCALESLLDIGSCVTVTSQHVAAALESVKIPAIDSSELNDDYPAHVITILERALRGRLPDRRFHGDAPKLLAKSLLRAARKS